MRFYFTVSILKTKKCKWAIKAHFLQRLYLLAFQSINSRIFQIAAVFYYLCVATLQYVSPIIICLYLTIMYKTLGGYSWNGSHVTSNTQSLSAGQSNLNISSADNSTVADGVTNIVAEFAVALASIKEANLRVLCGLFSFTVSFCFRFLTQMCFEGYSDSVHGGVAFCTLLRLQSEWSINLILPICNAYNLFS